MRIGTALQPSRERAKTMGDGGRGGDGIGPKASVRSRRWWRRRGAAVGAPTWGPSGGLLDGESLMGGPAVTAGLLGKYGGLCQRLEEDRRQERRPQRKDVPC